MHLKFDLLSPDPRKTAEILETIDMHIQMYFRERRFGCVFCWNGRETGCDMDLHHIWADLDIAKME